MSGANLTIEGNDRARGIERGARELVEAFAARPSRSFIRCGCDVLETTDSSGGHVASAETPEAAQMIADALNGELRSVRRRLCRNCGDPDCARTLCVCRDPRCAHRNQLARCALGASR